MTDATLNPPRDYAKWAFFAVIALCALLVIAVDERFLVVAGDPEWKKIQAFRWLLLVHGPLGAAALVAGPFQFSDRLRQARPAVHRWTGRVYIGAVAISAPIAVWIGTHFEPVTIRVEQVFQGGLWFLTTAIALGLILRRQIAAHKLWMMRSYGFCLVFVLSRVPDAWPGFHWTDQILADVLWSLVIAALVVPDLILTTRQLWKTRARRPA